MDELEKALKKLPIYRIEIGVISENAQRDEDIRNTKKKGKKKATGVTNAELMFIHENGSPLHNIPPRPVLEMTIDHTNKEWLPTVFDKITTKYLDSNFDENVIEKELNALCIEMEKYAQDIIYSNDGRLEPNSEAVALAKLKKVKGIDLSTANPMDGNHPLFDTGQLARSITCRVTKIYK